MNEYLSKPSLDKVLKAADLFTIIEAAGIDENSKFFEQELKFGIILSEEKYTELPDRLKKYFKKFNPNGE